ncbi:hypothetical protein TDB9533_04009 [Thalassocella blandensis]|nr:hypothetical protein TDB9533_04009 [Thalassocella blandensis]
MLFAWQRAISNFVLCIGFRLRQLVGQNTTFIRTAKWGALVGLLSTILGCGSVNVSEYEGLTPEFDVREFFNGELKAHGIVKNRSGKMIRYFVADIKATWKDGTGTLEETFVFNDGEKQYRTWTLTPQDSAPTSGSEKDSGGRSGKTPQQYIGTASDVIGQAELTSSGNALFLNYVLRIPYKDDTIDITVDDRMYLIEDNLLINESAMFKFGFNVGEVVLTIQKLP